MQRTAALRGGQHSGAIAFEGNQETLDFVAGAHTWNVDTLTFFLVDRLLVNDGRVDFDDWGWSIGASPTVNPGVLPATAKQHTAEQIGARQVDLIIDLLVRRNARYVEVVENKIFRKVRSDV